MYREAYAWGSFLPHTKERKAMEIVYEWFYGRAMWVVYVNRKEEWGLIDLFNSKSAAEAYVQRQP